MGCGALDAAARAGRPTTAAPLRKGAWTTCESALVIAPHLSASMKAASFFGSLNRAAVDAGRVDVAVVGGCAPAPTPTRREARDRSRRLRPIGGSPRAGAPVAWLPALLRPSPCCRTSVTAQLAPLTETIWPTSGTDGPTEPASPMTVTPLRLARNLIAGSARPRSARRRPAAEAHTAADNPRAALAKPGGAIPRAPAPPSGSSRNPSLAMGVLGRPRSTRLRGCRKDLRRSGWLREFKVNG